MPHSVNVITIQQGMHNYYPYFVITNSIPPLYSIYIINRTNQEQTTTTRTKQEQLKKEAILINNL